MFGSHGYDHVGLSDVAEAVAVGPSALYRHFASKDQLLAAVITEVADQFAANIETQTDPARMLPATATFTLNYRPIGVLWEREARQLPDEMQIAVRAQIRLARRRFIDAVHAAQPEIPDRHLEPVAAAALAVLLSPSFHAVELPRPGYDTLLAELAQRALTTELPDPTGPSNAPPPSRLQRAAKRERLLSAAVRLFAERTYARVSIEDVAMSVGISASTVYNYFPNKVSMLLTALDRANGYLQVTLDDTLATAHDPLGALHGLLGHYSRFALAHPQLLELLIAESHNIPHDQAAPLRQAQHEYVDEWVHLLRQVHTDLDTSRARVVVQSALMVINDLARTPRIRSRPDADTALTAICRHVLAI